MHPVARPAVALALLLAAFTAAARAGGLNVPGDYATIQEAIDHAANFDTITVAAGTFTGPLINGAKVLDIVGEGAELTIVDGGGAENVLLTGGAATTTLHIRRLTLTGGVTGARTTANGSLDLTQCTIRDNSGVGATGRIEANSCSFTGNGSHGLDGWTFVRFCSFEGNGGWGAQDIDSSWPRPILEDSRFLGNGLGGARFAVISNGPTFPGLTVITRCIFVGDKLQVAATQGAGTGETHLDHVTLLDTTVKLMQGDLFVSHSILRSETPITDLSPGAVHVSWSDLPGSWSPGTGDIDLDPLWADADGGDFSLLPGSPCINSGDSAAGKDLDGSLQDMGAVAYETWTMLGVGIPVGGFAPIMGGQGPLIAGQPFGTQIFPHQNGIWLIASLTELGAPFKGGTLWPMPDILFGPLSPIFGDSISLGFWPAGLPTGLSFVLQAWWPQAGTPQGYAATNGLRGVQP
jgi:hypothetical protein